MTIRNPSAGRPAIVMLLAFILFALAMARYIGAFDEGLILTGAMRVLDGDVPHRDFYANYGPAPFYILAGLFKLFGPALIIERLLYLLQNSAIIAVIYLLCRRHGSMRVTVGVTAIATLWMMGEPAFGYPAYGVLLLGLSSVLLTSGISVAPDRKRIVAAGALIGVAAFFRYDLAFFVGAGQVAAMAVNMRLAPSTESSGWMRAFLRMAAPYVAATAAVFLPVALWFLFVSSAAPFLHDIIEYPLEYYARMRGLPFPGPLATIRYPSVNAIYLPPAAIVLALIDIVRRHRSGDGDDRTAVQIQLIFLTLAMYALAITRTDITHATPALFPALVLIAGIVTPPGKAIFRIGGSLMLAVALAGGIHHYRNIELRWNMWQPGRSVAQWLSQQTGGKNMLTARCYAPDPIGFGLMLPGDEAAIRYVRARTDPGQRILIAGDRNDKIFTNDNALYFAMQRLPGTHWHQFDPGLQNRADIQRQLIGDIQKSRVLWIISKRPGDDYTEPNGSAISSGVFLLDDYLRRNFRVVQQLDDVTIRLRRDVPVPDPLPCGAS